MARRLQPQRRTSELLEERRSVAVSPRDFRSTPALVSEPWLYVHLVLPSRTALRVALRRAAHQRVDAPPLVFSDPFAIPILGSHATELDRTPRRPSSTTLRAWIVARSRFSEDTLAHATVHRGVTQYLLLGAGLDTFSLRNPYPFLRVFEVDHPATQEWKQHLLAAAHLSPDPRRTTLVPVDFERDCLPQQLMRAGLDPTRPTQIAWLGVVPYLTLAAFRSTITFFRSLPPGSGLVLDYTQPRHFLPPVEQLEHDSIASRVALVGESFQLFLTPDDMQGELSTVPRLQDLGRDELNALYFQRRPDGLSILRHTARLVSAHR